ncbi:hypothetical protein PR003_g23332 [Phytophthora rubi]|uniref:Uncharacterized protein n=1 Tax=Phytophthora rubi TaxID=129364 RepID=A0A6A4D5H1_9STRA|nr:hypothetical protein PR003_g23332 [Phytophthora rubi]
MTVNSREQSWGFLAPWCSELKGFINLTDLDYEEELWRQQYCLEVTFPRRSSFNTDSEFQPKFQERREALALVSAVAHVDYGAWEFLLAEYCGVKLPRDGDSGSDNDVKAELQIYVNKDGRVSDEDLASELIELCSVRQRVHPSLQYLAAVSRITALDKRSKPNKDLEIPVRLSLWKEGLPSDAMAQLLNIGRAKVSVREEWSAYESRQENDSVELESLRCTFVLEPMAADFSELRISVELKNTLEQLMLGNVWFYHVSSFSLFLAMYIDRYDPEINIVADEDEMFGQMMVLLFCTARQELASTSYRSSRLSGSGRKSQLLHFRHLELFSDTTSEGNFKALSQQCQ